MNKDYERLRETLETSDRVKNDALDENERLRGEVNRHGVERAKAEAEIERLRDLLAVAQAQVEEMEAELELCGEERDRWKILAGSQTLRDEIDRLQRELQEAQLRALKAEAGRHDG